MKKLSITIGISALLLAFMPLGCLAEETQQDVPYDANASQAVFQDVLREEECQAGMAFLGYIGEENVSAQDILDYAEQTFLGSPLVTSSRSPCSSPVCTLAYMVVRY